MAPTWAVPGLFYFTAYTIGCLHTLGFIQWTFKYDRSSKNSRDVRCLYYLPLKLVQGQCIPVCCSNDVDMNKTFVVHLQ